MKVAHSYQTLYHPMDYTVHGIFQARILEWVTFPFRGSSQSRDPTQVFCIAGGFFTSWATREALEFCSGEPIPFPADLPDPGIQPGSPALSADSLPTELSGKPKVIWCSLRIFQFVLFHTVKGCSVVSEAEVGVFFSGISLLSLWSNKCWQFDLWFLNLFSTQLVHLGVLSSCPAKA